MTYCAYDINALQKRLWDAADQFRANSGLKAGEYSGPVLDEGLPRAYTKELYAKKSEVLFEHVYEAYRGEGGSVFGDAGVA